MAPKIKDATAANLSGVVIVTLLEDPSKVNQRVVSLVGKGKTVYIWEIEIGGPDGIKTKLSCWTDNMDVPGKETNGSLLKAHFV
jgi:hypothetical protein